MYADDTTLLISDSTVYDISSQLDIVALGVSTCANHNKMALNTIKTSILFTTSQKFRFLSDASLNVKINGK